MKLRVKCKKYIKYNKVHKTCKRNLV